MSKIKAFLVTTCIGGIIVILPLAITVAVFGWIYNFVTNLIRPLTSLIVATADIKEFLASMIVILVILFFSFMVGILVKTSLGRFLHTTLDNRLIRLIPGYNLIKETVIQMIGGKKSPFSSVALSQLFENQTLVTSFITDEHEDGSYSVFVPTGPNPTSGNIFHLQKQFVHPVETSVEDAMRSIISCGAGSAAMCNSYRAKKKS